jgi:serine/threonine-protein kinase
VAVSPPKINVAELAAKTKAEARLGTVVSGRYRLTEVLAMGGVGVVYKGEHVHMRKKVAIKLLHPDSADAPDLVARFQREAVAGAHIQHPNVTAATDFGELDDGSFFLVLEYVRGTTLREIISRGPLGARRTVHIGKQLAAALAATHAIGIVHRDVTPRNVMVIEGERDQVKLIDFGLAKLDAASLAKADAIHHSDHDIRITGTGAVFGTIAYLAPEVVRGMDMVDARADLYALGIVLYEMLSGKHPFDTTDAVELFKRHALTRPPPIAARSPGVIVPPALEAIVMRLLEKQPEDRLPSAEAVIHALDTELEGLLTPSTPPPVALSDTGPAAPAPSLPPPALPSSPSTSPAPPAAASIPPPPVRPSLPPPLPRPSSPPPRPSAPPPLPAANAAASPLPFASPSPLAFPPAPLLPRISTPPPPPSRPAPASASPLPMPSGHAPADARVHPAPIAPNPFARPARTRQLYAGLGLAFVALAAVGVLWSTRADDPAQASATLGSVTIAVSSAVPAPPSPATATLAASAGARPALAPPSSAAAAASAIAAAPVVGAGTVDPEARALLRSTVRSHDYLHAVAPFRALAEHDPQAFHDPAVAVAARDLAVVLAGLPGPDTDFIYDTLANHLGADGVDVLYEIVRTRGGSKASSRALDLFKQPAVLARATPAVRVTYDFGQAACLDKLTLLDRATADGDVRTLMAMELAARNCFRQNQPLDDAIRTLRARLTAHPAP